VLVPAFTFPATFAAIRMAGGEPMLVDVNTATWSCDLDKLSQALKMVRPKAVMLVAPFGIAQDFAEHVKVCEAAGTIVIVDNAAGLGGGIRRNHEPPRENSFEVFSLHATKPFAVGEGGAIVADTKYVPELRAAINFGLPWTSDTGSRWGINGKLPEVTAAIGLAVLTGFPDVVRVRQQQAARYIKLFEHFRGIIIHRVVADSPWQVFPCLFPTPATTMAFVDEAARRGLEVRRYYRPSLADWGGLETAGDCSGAGYLAERMVSLPIYSRTTESEIDELHGLIKQCLDWALT
jgi:dTDP-4-amino-4,6-dideoxygalactose transaminase